MRSESEAEEAERMIANGLEGGPRHLRFLATVAWAVSASEFHAAVRRMVDDGRIVACNCDPSHDHEDGCKFRAHPGLYG